MLQDYHDNETSKVSENLSQMQKSLAMKEQQIKLELKSASDQKDYYDKQVMHSCIFCFIGILLTSGMHLIDIAMALGIGRL